MAATAMVGGTDNNQLIVAARTAWHFRQGVAHIVQNLPPLLKEAHAPHSLPEAEEEEAMMGGLWVLVVRVVCGVVRAGCVCAASPCCFVRCTCISALKIGKQRHIGDRQKTLHETNQTITFN
jgi:hypothetical protein